MEELKRMVTEEKSMLVKLLLEIEKLIKYAKAIMGILTLLIVAVVLLIIK